MLSMEQLINMPDEEFDKFLAENPEAGIPSSTPPEEGEDNTPAVVENESEVVPEGEGTPVVPTEGEGTVAVENNDPATVTTEEAVEEPDYKEFYEAVMAPVVVNGVSITPRTKEEAIALIQRGADYGNVTAELTKHQQTIMTLEKAGLLGDTANLDFLISLSKKDPAAIGKLLKDSGYDPLDYAHTENEQEYHNRGHVVDPKEVAYKTTIENIRRLPNGVDTLQTIADTWDEASVIELSNDPSTLNDIHNHRMAGIYDQVAQEVQRARLLGHIAPNVPFIQAYRVVGQRMNEAGMFNKQEPVTPQVTQPVAATPVARGVAPTTSNVNPIPAGATTTPRTIPTVSTTYPNPFEMTDAEFEKALAKMNRGN